jgi:hypothetical protein
MWPRLIAQLIELLPHVTRLVPMADKYLSSKAASDRTHAAALNSLGETMHGDLTVLSDSHAALTRQVALQMADQTAKISALQRSIDQAESDNIKINRQVEWLTKDVNSLRLWVKFGTATIVLLLAVTLALMIKLYLAR